MHGVAFRAKILMERADSIGSCDDECKFSDTAIAAGINDAIAKGAKVINMSLGGEGFGFTVLNAVRSAANSGLVTVIAAGNESQPDPSGFAHVAADGVVLGTAIVVGATDQNDVIADFSNRAGDLKDIFLVAPGVDLRSTWIDDQLAIGDGTSFAAPHVSGAVALLFQLFPNLTARDVVDILLTTATDLGAPGVDEIYGHGLLNLERAVQPIGTTAVPASADASVRVETRGSFFDPGSVFGDALAAGALDGVIMIDRYRRSYLVDLGAGVARARPAFSLAATMPFARRTELIRRRAGRFALTFGAHVPAAAEVAAGLGGLARTSVLDRRPFMAVEGTLPGGLTFTLARNIALAEVSDLPADPAAARGLFARAWRGPLQDALEESVALRLGLALGARWRLSVGTELAQADGTVPGTPAAADRLRRQRSEITLAHVGRRLAVAAGFSHVREEGLVFDARGAGALALGAGRHLGARLAARWALAREWALFATASVVRSRLAAADNPLLAGASALVATSYGGGLARRHLLTPGDELRLGYLAPLAVRHGAALFRLPTGRDYAADRFLFTDRSVRLAPARRERDLELAYGLPLGRGLRLDLGFRALAHPGHVARAGWGMEGGMRLGLRY
ncbi:MAG: hypothetical protein KatS3mg119_0566 [Rhodothalassiaceae bacterium]|nr:MAG: hypothetical protein KatS3mg119_0566 [Rhodothalassiaceae bacterium]